MSNSVDSFEPKVLWKHFAALSAIPRASTKEAAAREYVISQAKKLGLEYVQDAAGNVVVRKPARPGREKAPTTALQGHLDMVCEKNEGTPHNFDTDPIKFVQKGEWLYADGTTLGADNGIGVCAGLAVMESNDINHGPLEFVFTIDEETGLTGASEFQPGLLKSKYFLNLDNEEKGTACIGCAGGMNTKARKKVSLVKPKGTNGYRIKVSGLKGGHSGVDIHLGRGNAVRILGRVLLTVMDKLPIEISEMKGGSAHNAIPREAWAIVALSGRDGELKSMLTQLESDIRAELGQFDPELKISVENATTPTQVMDAKDAKQVLEMLIAAPHGVLAMSPDIPGLVQTSTNLATITFSGDMVEIMTSQRSSVESSKFATGRMVATVFRMGGFEAEHGSGYPGWKPEPNSDIVKKLQQVHTKAFGKEAKLIAMHAGLECGVIGEKNPGMQMVSFGPQIENPHSPIERVEIPSVADFWKLLTGVLEAV